MVYFKSQHLSHVVTFQGTRPLCTTEDEPNPIGYFEVKIMSLEGKDPSMFGVGLAGENFPMLKSAGSDKSVALRGNAKICYYNIEEKSNLGNMLNIDFKK